MTVVSFSSSDSGVSIVVSVSSSGTGDRTAVSVNKSIIDILFVPQ